MLQKSFTDIYNISCDVLDSESLRIEHLPEMFDHDTIDSSQPHVHTFYEIIWFTEPGGVYTVDFHNYEVKANSIFVLSPGQVHCFDGKTRHKGVVLKFRTDFLEDKGAENEAFLRYAVFNAFYSSPYYFVDNDKVTHEFQEITRKIDEEQKEESGFAHTELLRSLVKIFLINVYRYGTRLGTPQLDTMKPSHRLFVMFRNILEQNFPTMHLVQDYADRLNVSTKTLGNSVKECADKSPLAFINDRILLEAMRLLRFTDLRVKEIAYRLGYDDPSYFVKFFKRQTGVQPTEFRAFKP
jgi:AraC family transcriptional regulator, transcriptional activator of pobA